MKLLGKDNDFFAGISSKIRRFQFKFFGFLLGARSCISVKFKSFENLYRIEHKIKLLQMNRKTPVENALDEIN